MKPKLIVILGPTASGKSALALSLARKYNGEIISADSRQIYQKLNIGTSKPTRAEQRKVRHHLIDIVTPDKKFTLADYQKKAYACIEDCLRRGRRPILVGGTGLYLTALIENYDLPAAPPDQKLRRQWEKVSINQLASMLKKKSPKLAGRIDLQNRRRLIRALEMCLANIESQKHSADTYDILILGLNPARDTLYKRINERVDQMVRRGLEAETKKLFKGLRPRAAGYKLLTSTIGYQEWPSYWSGAITRVEAIEKIKQNTRHYAKRQQTWFRGMAKRNTIHWVKNTSQAETLIKKFLGSDNKSAKRSSAKRKPRRMFETMRRGR